MQPTPLILGDERFYQHLPFQFNHALLKDNGASLPRLTEDWVVQVIHTATAVLQIKFIEDFRISGCLNPNYHPVPLSKQIKEAWHAYTQEGNTQPFEGLPINFTTSPSGLASDVPHPTSFQLAIWQAVRGISFGRTTTYGQLAEQIGKAPIASRGVGGAVGRNPVPLLIPCHRVVPKNGTMTYYCQSSRFMEIKGFLLNWEASHTN